MSPFHPQFFLLFPHPLELFARDFYLLINENVVILFFFAAAAVVAENSREGIYMKAACIFTLHSVSSYFHIFMEQFSGQWGREKEREREINSKREIQQDRERERERILSQRIFFKISTLTIQKKKKKKFCAVEFLLSTIKIEFEWL